MPNPLRFAGLALLAALLAGCAFCQVDLAGLTTGSTESSYAAEQDRSASRLPGRVYILRGLGHIWSGGMTEMSDELNRRGVLATAHKHNEWYGLADEAIQLYKSDPDRWPIILIGHSNGGDNIILMAERLKAAGVPVALAVGFDPTRFVHRVPSNVRRFVNLYKAGHILGGGVIYPAANFRGQLTNVDLSNHLELGHMNIDRSRRLHAEVIAKILQVVAFPISLPQSMVSINYTVPTKAPIELWDGGLPVKLEPGQTLESLATQYGVPAWAIKQASGMAETGASSLEVGQRLVIPLHLNALTTTATMKPARGPSPPSISEPYQATASEAPRTSNAKPSAIGTWR